MDGALAAFLDLPPSQEATLRCFRRKTDFVTYDFFGSDAEVSLRISLGLAAARPRPSL